MVNGVLCIFCYDERLSQDNAPPNFPYMYHLRHDEDDWTSPISIEPFVAVNLFGTIFMKDPINFGSSTFVDVEQFEIKKGVAKIFVKRSLLKDITRRSFIF